MAADGNNLTDQVTEYFNAWLDSHDENWWDGAADGCAFEGSMAEAFAAGYAKCLEDHP
jgi:hypothetical protein